MEDEGDQPGRDRDQQVAPVGQRRGRDVADQDVAQEAAPETGHAGQHQHAEHVEAAPDPDQGPGDREHEDPDEVEHDQKGCGRHPDRLGLARGRSGVGSAATGARPRT